MKKMVMAFVDFDLIFVAVVVVSMLVEAVAEEVAVLPYLLLMIEQHLMTVGYLFIHFLKL